MSSPLDQPTTAVRGSGGRFAKAPRPSPSGSKTMDAAQSAILSGSQAILAAPLAPLSDLVINIEEAPAPDSGYQAQLSVSQDALVVSAALPSGSQAIAAASSAPVSGFAATLAASSAQSSSSKFRTSADFQATVAALAALVAAPSSATLAPHSPSYASIVSGTGGRVFAPALKAAVKALAPPAPTPLALGVDKLLPDFVAPLASSASAQAPFSATLSPLSKDFAPVSYVAALALPALPVHSIDDIEVEPAPSVSRLLTPQRLQVVPLSPPLSIGDNLLAPQQAAPRSALASHGLVFEGQSHLVAQVSMISSRTDRGEATSPIPGVAFPILSASDYSDAMADNAFLLAEVSRRPESLQRNENLARLLSEQGFLALKLQECLSSDIGSGSEAAPPLSSGQQASTRSSLPRASGGNRPPSTLVDKGWTEVKGKNSAMPSPSLRPMDKFLVPVSNRYEALRDSVDARADSLDAVLVASAIPRRVSTRPSRKTEKALAYHGALDKEESHAVANSRALDADEAPSEDTDANLPRDAHGYVLDGFNRDDDSDPSYMPSTQEDASSVPRSSSRSTSEQHDQHSQRFLQNLIRNHDFYQRSERTPLRGRIIVDSVVRRRTTRLRQLDTTIVEWFELPSIRDIDRDEIEMFMANLKYVESQYSFQLFEKAHATLHPELLSLLFACIQASLPEHAAVWISAATASHTRDTQHHAYARDERPLSSSAERSQVPAHSAPRNSSPASHAPSSSADRGQALPPFVHRHISPPSIRAVYPLPRASDTPRPIVVPTERPPRITDITDVATLTSTFAYQYRSYERSHMIAGVTPLSMFDCLSPQQQRSFSLFCDASLDALAVESNSRFLERCRQTWGVKSCAGAIDKLNSVRLHGDPLLRTSWVSLQLDFSNILESVPSSAMPSESALVKSFLKACDFEFMASCIRSTAPRTWSEALQQALTLLMDVNFITDARSNRSRRLGLSSWRLTQPASKQSSKHSSSSR